MKKFISALALCSVCLIPVTNFAETLDPPDPYAAPKPEMKKPKYKRMKPSAATLKKLREEAKKYTSAQHLPVRFLHDVSCVSTA